MLKQKFYLMIWFWFDLFFCFFNRCADWRWHLTNVMTWRINLRDILVDLTFDKDQNSMSSYSTVRCGSNIFPWRENQQFRGKYFRNQINIIILIVHTNYLLHLTKTTQPITNQDLHCARDNSFAVFFIKFITTHFASCTYLRLAQCFPNTDLP